ELNAGYFEWVHWAVPLVGEGDLRPRHAELHVCSLPAFTVRCGGRGGGPASSAEPVNCRRQFRTSIGLEEWPRDSRRATEEHEEPGIKNQAPHRVSGPRLRGD